MKSGITMCRWMIQLILWTPVRWKSMTKMQFLKWAFYLMFAAHIHSRCIFSPVKMATFLCLVLFFKRKKNLAAPWCPHSPLTLFFFHPRWRSIMRKHTELWSHHMASPPVWSLCPFGCRTHDGRLHIVAHLSTCLEIIRSLKSILLCNLIRRSTHIHL